MRHSIVLTMAILATLFTCHSVKGQQLTTIAGLNDTVDFFTLKSALDTILYQPDTGSAGRSISTVLDSSFLGEGGIVKKYNRFVHYWLPRVDEYGSYSKKARATEELLEGSFITCQPDNSAQISWTAMGPFETTPPYSYGNYGEMNQGQIHAVWIHPTNRDILLVGCRSGMFKTTDGGETWYSVTDDENLSFLGVSCIVHNPDNPNILFASTASSSPNIWNLPGPSVYGFGLLRSTDLGESWERVGPADDFTSSWEFALIAYSKVLALPFKDDDEPILFAIGARNSFYYNPDINFSDPVVLNRGWEQIPFTAFSAWPKCWDIEEDPNYTPPTGVNSYKVWITTLGQEANSTTGLYSAVYNADVDNFSWQGPYLPYYASTAYPNFSDADIGTVPTRARDISELLVEITGSGEILLKIKFFREIDTLGLPIKQFDTTFLAKTSDNGATWDYHKQIPNGRERTFEVSFYDSDVIYIETSNLPVKSTDGGDNFSNMSDTKLHVDIRFLDIYEHSSIGEDKLLTGNDGGVAICEDGDLWEPINGYGLNITQYYGFGGTEQNSELIHAGAQDGSINKYVEGAWSHRNKTGDNGECIIDPFNSNITHEQGNYTYYLYLHPDSSWESHEEPYPGSPIDFLLMPMELDPTDDSILFCGWDFIGVTEDKGNNWSNLSSPYIGNLRTSSIAISQDNPDVIYFSRYGFGNENPSNYGIWKITRTGTSTYSSPININGSLQDSVYNTDDIEPLDRASIQDIVVDPYDYNRVWVVLGNFYDGHKVYYTPDGGSNWYNKSTCLPNVPINTITYQRGTDDRLYIGTDIGVFYKEGSETTASAFDWEYYGQEQTGVEVFDLEINYCSGMLRAATFGRGIWEAPLLDMGHETYDITVSGTETWAGETIAKGDILVPSGATLNVSGTLYMPKDAVIIVERMARINVTGTITSRCGEMWGGIRVEGYPHEDHPSLTSITSGTYPDDPLHQGVVYVNGGTLENARNAVSTSKIYANGSFNMDYTGGGIVVANNATFKNNERSIEFLEFVDENVSKISNSDFVIDNDYLAKSVKPQITMWGVNNVEIIDNAFENNSGTLVGNEKPNGIYTIDAKFKCKGNTFDDLWIGMVATAWSNYNFPNRLLIKDNEFNDNGSHVYLKGVKDVLVSYNDFNDTYGSGAGIPPYSVYLNGCQASTDVYRNDLADANTGAVYTRGIVSLSSHADIYLNDLNGFDYAVNFYSNNSKTQAKCNNLSNSVTHDFVSDGSINNQGDNLFDLTTINSGPADNTLSNFSCTFPDDDEFKSNNSFTFKYYHHNSTMSVDLEPDCSSGSVDPELSTGSYTTQGNCELIESWDDTLDYDDNGGAGGLAMFNYWGLKLDTVRMDLDRNDFEGIVEDIQNPELADDYLLDILMDPSMKLSDQAFYELFRRPVPLSESDLVDVLLYHAPHTYMLMMKINELGLSPNNLSDIQQANEDSSNTRYATMMDYYYLQGHRQHYLFERIDDLVAADSISEAVTLLEAENTPFAISLLADVYMADSNWSAAETTLEAMYNDEQDYYQYSRLQQIQIAFGQDSTTIYDLDSVQRYTVENVAATNTFAAANACALLQWLYGDTACADVDAIFSYGSSKTAGTSLAEDKTTEVILLLQPNPADEMVSIFYNVAEGQNPVSIRMLDVNGKAYFQDKSEDIVGTSDFKTSTLPVGIYLIVLEHEGQVLKTSKLVIQR